MIQKKSKNKNKSDEDREMRKCIGEDILGKRTKQQRDATVMQLWNGSRVEYITPGHCKHSLHPPPAPVDHLSSEVLYSALLVLSKYWLKSVIQREVLEPMSLLFLTTSRQSHWNMGEKKSLVVVVIDDAVVCWHQSLTNTMCYDIQDVCTCIIPCMRVCMCVRDR